MILIDNNLSPKLVRKLSSTFFGIRHVANFKMESADDITFWRFAKENSFSILTKDTDFINLVTMRGFPPKVIRLNTGNLPTMIIESILLRDEQLIKSFLNSNTHGILEITRRNPF